LFNEIECSGKLNHPNIISMNGCSQDKRIVYIYLEYLQGGDLIKVINKFKKLATDHARFYIGQVLMAIDYLHSLNMIYRDLKPENILVCQNGYIKLCDFGFTKVLMPGNRTYTFCGTPEYIAPEIIQNKGYHHPVDYYALGIFIYECLYGRPPFMANDPYTIFKMVLEEKIKFPKSFDKDAKSLVKHLC